MDVKRSGNPSAFMMLLLRLWAVFIFIELLPGCNFSDSKNKAVFRHDSLKFIEFPDTARSDLSWSKENTVVIHILNEPDNLHPTNGRSSIRGLINNYIHKTLMRVNLRTLDLEPELVEDLPEISDDKLKFTYRLRKDIRWDDGVPVTAADVLFTFKANKYHLVDNPHSKPYLDNLEDIVLYPGEPYKFTIRMKAPYILNIAFLADFPLIQQRLYDPTNLLQRYTLPELSDSVSKADTDPLLVKWAAEFNDPRYGRELNYIRGLGPYKVISWEPGELLILEKKKNHWTERSTDEGEQAKPQRIAMVINKDPNSQEIEFKKQTYDATASLSTATLLKLQKDSSFNKNYHSLFIESYSYSYIALNMRPDGRKRKKFFTDKRVRRALALLTPIDTISAVLNSSRARRMISPVFPQSPEFHSGLKPLPYDITSAKALLGQAGWTDSDQNGILEKTIDGRKEDFIVDLAFINNSPASADMPLMLAEAYEKAGIKVNLQPMDYSVIYQQASTHDFDMMIGIWTGDYLPQDFAQIWHSSSWLNNGSNFTGFGTDESDSLIDSINRIAEPEDRIAPVKHLQEIIYEEQPYIFLFQGTTKIAVHKRFGNITIYKEKPYFLVHHWNLLPTSGTE